MRMTTNQQFHSHLLGLIAQRLLIPPRNNLMTMDHAYTYSTEIEDLCCQNAYFLLLEVRQGFIFVVPLHDVEDRSESLAPIENFSTAHISGAENSANLIWNDHLLVFSGYLCRSEGNMEIPNDQSELTYLLLLSHVDILLFIYNRWAKSNK